MSRVLRRPMFRGGSTNMNGIMSGIQDRKNYAVGTENIEKIKQYAKELEPAMQEIMGPYEKPTGFENPLYQLGIQTGLDLMSKADSQSLIRNIASATGRQTPQLFKSLAEERDKKAQYDKGIKSGALGLAGDILGREISASGRTEKMDPIEALKFETEFKRYGGVLDFNVSDRQEYESNKKRLIELGKENKIVYDPFENNYKRITMVGGQPQFDEAESVIELMQIPLPTMGEPEQTDRSVPDFGMSIDDPSA
jgi:hypothetical protein